MGAFGRNRWAGAAQLSPPSIGNRLVPRKRMFSSVAPSCCTQRGAGLWVACRDPAVLYVVKDLQALLLGVGSAIPLTEVTKPQSVREVCARFCVHMGLWPRALSPLLSLSVLEEHVPGEGSG